jgi:hypothetical protein
VGGVRGGGLQKLKASGSLPPNLSHQGGGMLNSTALPLSGGEFLRKVAFNPTGQEIFSIEKILNGPSQCHVDS